jgi:hypothetical protein
MPYDFFNPVITIAIGLAALASLLTLFIAGVEFDEADVRDFRGILLSCILICLGVLIPPLLSYAFESAIVWSISSVAFVLIVILLQVQLELDIRAQRYTVWTKSSYILRIFTVIVNLIVFINIFAWQRAFPFIIGIFWVLTVTALRLYIFLVSVTNAYSLPNAYRKRNHDEKK